MGRERLEGGGLGRLGIRRPPGGGLEGWRTGGLEGASTGGAGNLCVLKVGGNCTDPPEGTCMSAPVGPQILMNILTEANSDTVALHLYKLKY